MFFLSVFAFLAIGRVTDPFPFLWPFRLVMVTGALAAITWFLAPGSFTDKVPFKIPQMRYVIMMACLAVVSVPLSVWPGASFVAVSEGLWRLVLFFILVCYWCKTVQDARRLIWMCCFGVSILLLVSIATGNTGGDDPSGRRFSAGSMYDPNDLALILAMLIPLLVFLLSTSGSISKLLILGMALLYFYGIVLTQSRGGFLALVAVASLLLFRTKLNPSLKLIISAGILLIFVTVAGTVFWDRISTIWEPKTEYDRTAGDRFVKWQTALVLIVTRPWGSGYGACDIAIGRASGMKDQWMTAHNSFLQVGVELGVPGLIIFLSLLMRTFKDLRQFQFLFKRQQNSETNLASMLEISLYGFVVGGFFLSQAYSMLLYLIIGLSLALSRQGALLAAANAVKPIPMQGWSAAGHGQYTRGKPSGTWQ